MSPEEDPRELARAARLYINQATGYTEQQRDDLEFEAFMSIFHPKVQGARLDALRRERRRNR